MTAKRSGLGRNLSALLGNSNNSPLLTDGPKEQSLSLSVNCLQPGKYQPRADIEQKPLEELANSIKQQGVIQPLIVRELDDGRYEIIAGERRWRASKIAGLQEVPVVLKQVDDETAMAMALVENLQREDLNAMDQARAMERLTSEFSLTHQQIAELLGKSRTAVSNYLRLLALSDEVKRLLEYGDIDMGHARALLALQEEQQFQVAQIIVAKQLSVRESEKLINRVKSGERKEPAKESPLPVDPELLDKISGRLETKLLVKPGNKGRGSLVIPYKNQEMLDKILRFFM